jgi:FSR family fosmidomycin resistance protein-like MFS transporter
VPTITNKKEVKGKKNMAPQNRHRWLILIMFMVAHAVNDGLGWIMPPLLPALRDYFSLSYTEMGAFYTLYRFFGSFFQAPFAYLVHLIPISTILGVGLLCASVGMFLASLSSSYSLLVWFSAISGIGRSTYHPLAVTTLSRIFGRDALGRAMGLHLSGSAAGNAVAPLLVALLLGISTWRLPLQVWSVLGVCAGLSLLLFLRHYKQDLQPREKPLRWPFVSRSIGIYLLAASIWGMAQGGVMAFLPLFLVEYQGFSTGAAAANFGIMALSGTICRPFLGALMDRMGRRKPVIIGGYIIAGLSILTIATMNTLWTLYPAILMLGIFGIGHTGLADVFMVEQIPSHRREETLGFYYTLRMGMMSLSPLLVGFASERISLSHAFLTLALVASIPALLLGLARERQEE